MKEIHRLLAIFAALLACVPSLSAQQADAVGVVERVADMFRKAGGIQAGFTARTSEGSSTGTIRLKGDKFLLETQGVTTWFDGRTQWSYLPSTGEVNISEPSPEELQALNPYAWLSLYRENYRVEWGKMNNPGDSSLYYKVVLTATDAGRDLQGIVLQVSRETFRPVRLTLKQRGGEEADIAVTAWKSGQAWADSLFVFDAKQYPDAEVVDLR